MKKQVSDEVAQLSARFLLAWANKISGLDLSQSLTGERSWPSCFQLQSGILK